MLHQTRRSVSIDRNPLKKFREQKKNIRAQKKYWCFRENKINQNAISQNLHSAIGAPSGVCKEISKNTELGVVLRTFNLCITASHST